MNHKVSVESTHLLFGLRSNFMWKLEWRIRFLDLLKVYSPFLVFLFNSKFNFTNRTLLVIGLVTSLLCLYRLSSPFSPSKKYRGEN